MKRLTEEQKNDIVARYQRGEQSKDIAVVHNIRDNSVARVLRKLGIERTKVKRISQDIRDRAVKMYVEDKVSSELIAATLDIDPGVVRRAVIKAGHQIRPATENKRQYTINDTFFETINTETNAYFLGFLYADGGLSSTGNGIRLELQEMDIDALQKFSMAIYGFLKIEDDPFKDDDGNVVRMYKMVNVYSQKMHADLIKLGCTPRKSFTIKFPSPDIVPDYLMQHFIRGFMDGDGCICITNETRPRVDFTSTSEFLTGLSEYLIAKLNVGFSKQGQRHTDRETNTRNIQTQGFDNCRKLLDFLYMDATIFLDRKKSKYDEMLLQQTKRVSRKTAKYDDPTKYGTTYIPTINGHQLTKEYLTTLGQDEKDAIIEPLLAFYRENGFPQPGIEDDALLKEFIGLKNADMSKMVKDGLLQPTNYVGTNIFKHFSPHFYEVNGGRNGAPSMLDTFNDDDLLRKVIKNRLDQDYSLTGNELKSGLANSKIAFKASIFNCVIAKHIYAQYTKENDVIYDYSMGFGQRLLGALSLPHHITYVGVDPLEKSVESNQAIFDFFAKNVPMLNKSVDLRCIGSESFCDEKYFGKVNLAFSSPPYYNLEVYGDDASQAYSNGYVNFLNRYWRQTVANIGELLADDGVFALNITDVVDGFNVGEDMSNVAKEAGLVLVDTLQIQQSRNLEFGGQKETHKTEPIYVFRRK